jgi:hypothetical protein
MLHDIPRRRKAAMPATTAPPVLPPSWLTVLETIEQSLDETLRRTDERARALAADSADGSGRDAAWGESLARLDDRLAALEDGTGRARRIAAAAEAALADEAEGLDRWLKAARLSPIHCFASRSLEERSPSCRPTPPASSRPCPMT